MLHTLTIHYLKDGIENKIRIESSLRKDLEDIVKQIDLRGVITITFDVIKK